MHVKIMNTKYLRQQKTVLIEYKQQIVAINMNLSSSLAPNSQTTSIRKLRTMIRQQKTILAEKTSILYPPLRLIVQTTNILLTNYASE